MDETELLQALLELAQETGLRVQRVGRQPVSEGLSPSHSGVVRLRGEVRVLLADSDPLASRIRVLAGALQRDAGDALAGRFLPPAVRECLEAVAEGDSAKT